MLQLFQVGNSKLAIYNLNDSTVSMLALSNFNVQLINITTTHCHSLSPANPSFCHATTATIYELAAYDGWIDLAGQEYMRLTQQPQLALFIAPYHRWQCKDVSASPNLC